MESLLRQGGRGRLDVGPNRRRQRKSAKELSGTQVAAAGANLNG